MILWGGYAVSDFLWSDYIILYLTGNSNWTFKPWNTYIHNAKVEIINTNLEDSEDIDVQSLIEDLGNDVAAIGSVPASIYSFFAGSTQNNASPFGIEDDCFPFEKCLKLAMLFGGDADTICSMTGKIAFFYI